MEGYNVIFLLVSVAVASFVMGWSWEEEGLQVRNFIALSLGPEFILNNFNMMSLFC